MELNSSSYSVQIGNEELQGNGKSYTLNGNGGARYSRTRTCSLCCGESQEGSSSCPLCRQQQEMDDNQEPQLRAIKVEPAVPAESNNIAHSTEHQTYHSSQNSKEVKKQKRKWEYFPGKNKFYCNGRLMTAPSIRFFIMCLGLIVFTFSLFIIFDGVYLGEKLSIAIPIVGSILFLSVIVNMVRTSCTDPGILPRASQQESEYMDKLYATNNQVRPPPRTKDIVVNGQTMKSKYCFTCKMFRPPRASHCGVCDNCVDRFDHHCPFLGNCIGKRNYSSFYAFVVSLCLLSVFVLSCSVAHLVLVSKDKGNFLEALKASPTSAIVVVISFFGMWTVFGLAGFHTYLIAVEQTTNEDIKGIFGKSAQKNPFSKGNFCNNCCFVLCGPIQPSLVDARGAASSDFLLSLPKKLEQNSGKVNRCSNLQASIKTGPHCVENQPSGGLKSHQQLPLMTTQQGQHPPYPYPQQQYTHVIPQEPPLERISPTPLQSPETPKADSALSPSSSSANRQLPEMSESLKNLYYSSIEEDPEEQDERNTSTTMTITPEPVPLSKLRKGMLNNQYNVHGNRSTSNGYSTDHYEDDDFDDPTVLHTVSASLDRVSYDDMDDPIPASASISGASVKSSNRKSTGKRSSKKSSSSVTTPTSSVSDRSSVKLRTSLNASNLKQHGSTEYIGTKINSNSMRQKSGDGKPVAANGSATKTKRISDSTMINSPLHLDPIM